MLSDAQLRTLKPKDKMYRKADGGGLMIQVETSGSKLWRIAYRIDKKQRMLSGGKYPAVTLAAARAWRDEVKATLARGEDPGAVRKAESAPPIDNSFETVARAWLSNRALVLDPKYQKRLEGRFEQDVFKAIGKKAVPDITKADILDMLRRIEARGAIETSHRIRTYCSHVFEFADAEGHKNDNPTLGITAAQKQRPAVVHRAKVQPKDMGAFLVKLREDEAVELTHLAIHFTLLTWSRTVETRFASVAEIENLGGSEPLWRIPADRMKMRNEHLVPLSRQTVEIVKRLREINPRSHWLFPVPESRSGVISENRMLDTMYRMGLRGKATIHGFRGTASTWANETLKYHPDVTELALSHVPSGVRATYNSALYLAPRRVLLQDWADWLDVQAMQADVLG